MSPSSNPTPTPTVGADPVVTALEQIIAPKSVLVFDPSIFTSDTDADQAARVFVNTVIRQLANQNKLKTEAAKVNWCIDHLELTAREKTDAEWAAGRLKKMSDFTEWFGRCYFMPDVERRHSVYAKLAKLHFETNFTKLVWEIRELWDLNKTYPIQVSEDEFISRLLSNASNVWQDQLRGITTFDAMLVTARTLTRSSQWIQPNSGRQKDKNGGNTYGGNTYTGGSAKGKGKRRDRWINKKNPSTPNRDNRDRNKFGGQSFPTSQKLTGKNSDKREVRLAKLLSTWVDEHEKEDDNVSDENLLSGKV